MPTRSAPWQYEWKHPVWNTLTDESDFSIDGVPISLASALLTSKEVEEWAKKSSPEEDSFPEYSVGDEDHSFLLSATLYAPDKPRSNNAVGDVLLLELIHHKKSGAKRRKHRMLRWPGSTMDDENTEKSREWHLTSWISKRPQRVGLVSVSLCRLPPGEDLISASMDAMDVVTLLSLGLDLNESSAPHNTPIALTNELEHANDDNPTDLILACLTTDGRVLLYSPQQFFQPNVVDCQGGELSDGLASLMLGSAIHQQLEQSVLPLSQPLSVIPLSVPLKRRSTKTAQSKNEHLDVIPENLVLPDHEDDDSDEEVIEEDFYLWEGSFWDANIETSTMKYHTLENVPSLLVPAFEFLAVAGRGTQARRIRRRSKTTSSSRGSSVSSWETTSHQEEKWEFSAKTDSDTADLIDASGWWKKRNKKESKEGGTRLPEDDVSDRNKKLKEKNMPRWVEYEETGGFITFLSLRHYAESRTVFLPFAPKQLSAVVWGGMHFVIVLGEESLSPRHTPLAMAIRVDSFNVSCFPQGEAPTSYFAKDSKEAETSSMEKESTRDEKKKAKCKTMCTVRRFHLIPIILPSEGPASKKAVAISSTLTDPPGIILQYSSEPEMTGDLVITLNTLHLLDVVPTTVIQQVTAGHHGFGKTKEKAIVIKTQLQMEHVARIPHKAEPSTTRNTWCHLGQGWSLFGVDEEVFFICWEGATAAQGAFVSKIHSEEEFEGRLETLTSLHLSPPVTASVLPLYASPVNAARHTHLKSERGLQLPFTSPYRMPSFVSERGGTKAVSEDTDTVDVVKDALDSLMLTNLSSQSSNFSPLRRPVLSSREKSVRLVRYCSSWTLLDATEENKTYYENQVPLLVIQLGPLLREHFLLSLRKVVVDNATASPFNQVLGWLSQSKDYFTAASVALDLLRDVDSLRNLRRAKEGVHFDNERANLEGLLDGIFPLYVESSDSSDNVLPSPNQSVLTQLADMTVGCLLKGGLSISHTLENFVRRDPNYDPGRACLMLVSATVCCLSRDPRTKKSVMGADYEWPSNGTIPTEDLVWPLRSLFQIGVARDYLPTILLLLNAAIPDELRARGRDGDVGVVSPESLEICISIVSMIVASSAAELLLGLMDEATGKRYWLSLENDTQLELSLISIDGVFPLLRQSEVRNWILSEMDKCIRSSGSLDASKILDLSNDWLKMLCEACLANAGCDLEYILPDASEAEHSEWRIDDKMEDDGTLKHFETRRLAIEALTPSPGTGGLDFDMLIPALLLLAYRDVPWRRDSCLATQSLLDAACYLAGRHRKEEPMFAFDGPNVMKLCALSGNVSAGANLIGGKNGLVLMCCDILIKGTGISMEDAEDFILNDEIAKSSAYIKMKLSTKQSDQSPFHLTDEHRSVLWLLDEYVLSIKTFGDFGTTYVRGKVDPVFAARSCLRTWFLLSWKETKQATAWLVDWLRHRLGIAQDQVRRKRLACSALTCALMWPTSDEVTDVGEIDTSSDETILANALKMESLFLVQLAQSSCGLVESLPPSFVQEVLRQVVAAEAGEKRNSSFQVNV